jgi:hypothetical protein
MLEQCRLHVGASFAHGGSGESSGIERDRVRTNEIRNGIGINQEVFYYHYLRGPATEQRAECP